MAAELAGSSWVFLLWKRALLKIMSSPPEGKAWKGKIRMTSLLFSAMGLPCSEMFLSPWRAVCFHGDTG